MVRGKVSARLLQNILLLPELHADCFALGACEQICLVKAAFLVFPVKRIDKLYERFVSITDKLVLLRAVVRLVMSVVTYCTFHDTYSFQSILSALYSCCTNILCVITTASATAFPILFYSFISLIASMHPKFIAIKKYGLLNLQGGPLTVRPGCQESLEAAWYLFLWINSSGRAMRASTGYLSTILCRCFRTSRVREPSSDSLENRPLAHFYRSSLKYGSPRALGGEFSFTFLKDMKMRTRIVTT